MKGFLLNATALIGVLLLTVGCALPEPSPPLQVAAPVFSVPAGTYSTAQTVSITTPTAGAQIRYTIDRSYPDASTGTVYTKPVMISKSLVLRAVAYLATGQVSSTTSAKFTMLSDSTIDITEPWSPTIKISGVPSSFPFGSDFTAKATVTPSPDLYQWYIDGTEVTNGKKSTVTLGASLEGGSHVLALLVVKGSRMASRSVAFTVDKTADIQISVTGPWTPSVAFTGLNTQIGFGNTMTVTVAVSPLPDAYQWYVDGSAVAGATSDTATFGSDLEVGLHSVTLVATQGDMMVAGTGYFEVHAFSVEGIWEPVITLTGFVDSLPSQTSMTVVASINPAADSYDWYLDGVLQSSNAALQVGSSLGLGLGNHDLALVATKDGVMVAENYPLTVVAP